MYISEEEYAPYAELILHLVALEEGDELLINAEFEHKNLVYQLYAKAYQRGAKFVHINVGGEYLDGLRAQYSKKDHLRLFPKGRLVQLQDLVKDKACIISIRSPEDPKVNKGVSSENLAIINNTLNEQLVFFRESIMSDRQTWIVTAAPTVGWAKNVFPNLDEAQGVRKLWDACKKILRLDTPDPIKAWEEHQAGILNRRNFLNNKKYSKLRFVSEGTDLTVALHERSVWLGALHKSENNRNFQANVPTEEVYTSPDCRYTEGYVRVKRPLPIFGKRVEVIKMEFRGGRLTDAQAKIGNDNLQEFIRSDERNRFLGEIAMVDINSPIWQSQLTFNSILYDENAGVHFALGKAYPTGYGFTPNDSVSESELIEMGCNSSKFHMDFVIGDEHMCINGITRDGKEESIMENGLFIKELR